MIKQMKIDIPRDSKLEENAVNDALGYIHTIKKANDL